MPRDQLDGALLGDAAVALWAPSGVPCTDPAGVAVVGLWVDALHRAAERACLEPGDVDRFPGDVEVRTWYAVRAEVHLPDHRLAGEFDAEEPVGVAPGTQALRLLRVDVDKGEGGVAALLAFVAVVGDPGVFAPFPGAGTFGDEDRQRGGRRVGDPPVAAAWAAFQLGLGALSQHVSTAATQSPRGVRGALDGADVQAVDDELRAVGVEGV